MGNIWRDLQPPKFPLLGQITSAGSAAQAPPLVLQDVRTPRPLAVVAPQAVVHLLGFFTFTLFLPLAITPPYPSSLQKPTSTEPAQTLSVEIAMHQPHLTPGLHTPSPLKSSELLQS